MMSRGDNMLTRQLSLIRQKTDFVPEIAIVLGSGLGALADKTQIICEISYSEIDGLPVSTAPSHKGSFIFGILGGRRVVIMNGRVHLYEGYTSKEVVKPIRLMRLLGAKTIIFTNAAGGINRNFNAGELMLINDHISCFVPSPLIGKNEDTLGVRFPDMSNCWDKELRDIIRKTAVSLGIKLNSGIYAQLTGPQFESPAEIKMLSAVGADAVGMSTVIEAIAARHCGFRVAGISLITNLACGLLDKPLTSEEVTEAAKKAAPEFEKLIIETIRNV